MTAQSANKITAIIGTGVTGLSVARFLQSLGQVFVFFDTRETPPNGSDIKCEFPHVECQFGAWNETLLHAAGEIIMSPGISRTMPAIVKAEAAGVAVLGDVELFLRFAKAPIVAITGSNAKSTVTTWVGEMAHAAGIKVAVGGNLGTPVLALLNENVGMYILELSSFQLELIDTLGANVACILNLSEDHLDRYQTMAKYSAVKQRIYSQAKIIVTNNNDALTMPTQNSAAEEYSFGSKAGLNCMSTLQKDGDLWLADNLQPLIPVRALKVAGKHNIDNALAAYAIGKAAGLPQSAMLAALGSFTGLPHRCQWVAEHAEVSFYNDSKGTNVGATIAAVQGLDRRPHKLILIMGGEGKGANFKALRSAVSDIVGTVVLMGRDAPLIEQALIGSVKIHFAAAMNDAVYQAFAAASKGDAVLLSPACASFDMFDGYQDRGNAFCRAVQEVCCG